IVTLCTFFFSNRRRHTRSKRDWSSDVCSSDLDGAHDALQAGANGSAIRLVHTNVEDVARIAAEKLALMQSLVQHALDEAEQLVEIGRASCRERGRKTGGERGGEANRTMTRADR